MTPNYPVAILCFTLSALCSVGLVISFLRAVGRIGDRR